MVNDDFDLNQKIIEIIKDIQSDLIGHLYRYGYTEFHFNKLESYLQKTKNKNIKIIEIDKLVNLSLVYEKTNIIYELLKFSSLKFNMINLSYLLELSCKYNRINLVKTILALPNVDIEFLKSYGAHSFKYAAQNGYVDIIREFKKYITIEDIVKATSNIALIVSITNNRYEVFLELIEDKYIQSILHNYNNQFLIYASEANAYDIVKELLRFSLVEKNIIAQDNKAFCQAAYKGHYELVQLFLTYPDVIKDIHNKKALDYYGGISAYNAAIDNKYNKVASLIGIVIKLKYYAMQLASDLENINNINNSDTTDNDILTEEIINDDSIFKDIEFGIVCTQEEKFRYLLFDTLEKSRDIVSEETISALYQLYPSNFLKRYIDKSKIFCDNIYFHSLYGDKNNIISSLEITEVFDGSCTRVKLKI